MGRPAKPWFRKSKNAWYCKHGDKQVYLAPGDAKKSEVDDAFYKLKAGKLDKSIKSSMTVAIICDLFLDYVHKKRSKDTYRIRKEKLSAFCKKYGHLKASSLKNEHVYSYIDNPKWGPTVSSIVVQSIRAAFRWAVKEQLLEDSPILTVKAPTPKHRAHIMSEDQVESLIAHASDSAKDILTFMRETGVRPGEARTLTIERCDLPHLKIVVKGKTGERAIPIAKRTTEKLAKIIGDRKTGEVFVTGRGNPFSATYLTRAVWAAAKKAKVDAGGFAYSLRHRFISNALDRGVDSLIIAKIVGHKNVSQLEKTYARPKDETLRNAIEQALGDD